jgi:hypothetical protein
MEAEPGRVLLRVPALADREPLVEPDQAEEVLHGGYRGRRRLGADATQGGDHRVGGGEQGSGRVDRDRVPEVVQGGRLDLRSQAARDVGVVVYAVFLTGS